MNIDMEPLQFISLYNKDLLESLKIGIGVVVVLSASPKTLVWKVE